MEVIKDKNGGPFHLAGIVPIAGQPLEFNFQWHDSLMPISPNWTMVEHAVYECAMAGCNTIWIVANSDLAPLVRKTIGDWIYDPVYYERTHTKFYKDHRREVPIYYVPIHPKDRDRRTLTLRYSPQYFGNSSHFPDEIKARLSPTTLELTDSAPYDHLKEIVKLAGAPRV